MILNKTTVPCAVALALGLTTAANAQQAPANTTPAQATPQTVDEVTVTGSRIRRTTDFDTANPTTVVDSTYLRNLGIVNVGDAIAQLPANVSNNTPATTGNSSFFSGSTIANLRGLNPYFGSRTLNLVNSRRFVPTNQGDGVDLNFIPSVLIDRVDVVTGGASAAYGSGAISGVNNIFLNRKLEGGRADIDFGQTAQSDGDDKHVGLAYGMKLFGDRGHFVLGYEYQDTDPIGCYNARDWCKKGVGFYQTANPSLTLGSDVRSNQMSTTGTFYVTDARTTTLQATADGTGTQAFNIGKQPESNAFLSFLNVVPGGDGKSIYQYTNLRAPVKRNVATGTFTFAVTDTVNLNVDLSYGKVETANITGALDAQATAITAQNAFLTPALEAARVASVGQFPFPGADALINKDWTSQVDSGLFVTTDVKRAAFGLDGKFGESSWSWDGYYQYGLTNREQVVQDNRHLNAYNYATDSVLVGGVPTCRVLSPLAAPGKGFADLSADQQSIAAGCVPLNPFGNQALSAAAKAYAFGNLDEDLRYEQQMVALNATGDLFKGFDAGPIQGAIGVEYRTEKGENIAKTPVGTPAASRSDYLIQYGESFAGDVDITEGYVEVSVPVLKNVVAAKRLDFDFALRESQYKNQGKAGTTGQKSTHDLTTWKISGIWDPVDWLRFRGSRSRDARAANFRELYYGQKIGAGGLFGFCGAVRNTDACNWSLEGNSNLDPETADTTTLGVVFTPEDALPGFQFAADYFRIQINDAIQQASVQGVLSGCAYGAGDPAVCALLTTAVPGDYTDITDLRALASNGSGYMFKGVDFTGSYSMTLRGEDSLAFRLLATRMIDQQFQALPGGPFVNVVGQTGTGNSFLADNQPTAKWSSVLSATFTHGPISVTGQGRYVGKGIMDYQNGRPASAGGRTLSENSVPSYEVFALTGTWTKQDIGPLSSLQIYGVIDNLFDKDPPVAAGGGAFGPSNNNGGTNAVFYDTAGRTYRLGLRTTF
ncbi:MAG: TonB-dependent receptor [Gammaproteobacteria bacterium]